MTATSSLATIFALSLNHDWSFSLTVNILAILAITLALSCVFCARWFLGGRNPIFELDTTELGIGSHKVSFKPNIRDQEIAYKIWVELSTRKIGLPIDLKHDVISEVYDSWYSFFSITRELIKDIPVSKVKNPSTKQIVALSIAVLNEGLRPHLTRWQARFRRWYDHELDKTGANIDPQSIQTKYPEYPELTKDLLVVNKRLMQYRKAMSELVLGKGKEITEPE